MEELIKFKKNDIILIDNKLFFGKYDGYSKGIVLGHTLDFSLKVKLLDNGDFLYIGKECLKRNPDCVKKELSLFTLGEKLSIINKKLKLFEEENKMENKINCRDILKLWLKKNLKKIEEKFENEKDKILNKDMIVSEVNEYIEEVVEKGIMIKEKYGITHNFSITPPNLFKIATQDTIKEINKIKEKYEIIGNELRETVNEVMTAVSICENEESLRKILKAYNILDKDGKIKVK